MERPASGLAATSALAGSLSSITQSTWPFFSASTVSVVLAKPFTFSSPKSSEANRKPVVPLWVPMTTPSAAISSRDFTLPPSFTMTT